MTIFVSDQYRAGGWYWRYLFSDAGEAGVAELHAFARRIGASRDRFRGPHERVRSRRSEWSHYRITEDVAAAAFRAGAIKADRITLVLHSSGKRAAARLAKQLAEKEAAA